MQKPSPAGHTARLGERGVEMTGTIMYNNGNVKANDIEMLLEAYATNEEQFYLDRHNNDIGIAKWDFRRKSNVIRLPQGFEVPYQYD